MSNSKNHSKRKKVNKHASKKKINLFRLAGSILLIGALILLFTYPKFNQEKKIKTTFKEPMFKKEGELTFYKYASNTEIAKIDIEIADSNFERAQGLMYRSKMKENNGMLFIMRKEEPQSFWMKNTYISLDILFVNKDMEIVSIEKYTQTLSEDPIPSHKNAKYVVEVIAGFCDKYNIQPTDYIKYTSLK